MALVYIEYISRRPDVDIATFIEDSLPESQEGWGDNHADDRLLLNLGRTWRLGPEPEYLGVWYTPAAGLDRLDDWDRIFQSGAVNHLERPFHDVARIDAAGCYTPLREPVAAPRRHLLRRVLSAGRAAAEHHRLVRRARRPPAGLAIAAARDSDWPARAGARRHRHLAECPLGGTDRHRH